MIRPVDIAGDSPGRNTVRASETALDKVREILERYEDLDADPAEFFEFFAERVTSVREVLEAASR